MRNYEKEYCFICPLVCICSRRMYGQCGLWSLIVRTESDDVLDGIQKKIELAMNNLLVQNTATPLDSLFTKLNKLEDEWYGSVLEGLYYLL